ncbi:MAG TPA: PASTA domain-containing protein [Pyrinomonadaceae bacterium]|nr:PASTA domain-containing protein [Pyrinomonadaceae bacterium]
MNTATGPLSALRRLSIAIAIAVVFIFGLATTVYLSLRSPEVRVPDVLGKDRFEAERILGEAGLNFRVRSTRPSNELKADTVLFQVPRGGEVVKAGQTIAMDISRSVKEGEASEAVAPEKEPEKKPENKNTSDNSLANENKPKQRNKNANKNANDNSNANRNLNANRPAVNRNSNTNGNASGNANRPPLIINNNANRSPSPNENRRPAAPRPSPVARPTTPNP